MSYDWRQGSQIENHVTGQSYRSEQNSFSQYQSLQSPKAQFGGGQQINFIETSICPDCNRLLSGNRQCTCKGQNSTLNTNFAQNNQYPSNVFRTNQNNEVFNNNFNNNNTNNTSSPININYITAANNQIIYTSNLNNAILLPDDSFRNLETFGNIERSSENQGQLFPSQQQEQQEFQWRVDDVSQLSGNGLFLREIGINNQNEHSLSINIVQPYNPRLVPPDWEAAKRHGAANRVGMDKKPEKGTKAVYEMCPCCNSQIEKDILSISDDPLNLLFLGSGYPLFFDFLKFCIYILITILTISGTYDLYKNYTGTECQKKPSQQEGSEFSKVPCHRDFISITTHVNKKETDENTYIQDILDYFTVLALILLFVLFRKAQIERDIQCDVLDLTPSDYTIMVKDIPKNISKKVLSIFFEDILLKEDNSEFEKSQDDIKGERQSTQGGISSRRGDVASLGVVSSREKQSQDSQGVKVTEINYVFIHNKFQEARIQKEKGRFQMTEPRFAIGHNMKLTDAELRHGLESAVHEIEGNPDNFNGYAFVSFQSDKQRDIVLNCAEIQSESSKHSILSIIKSIFLGQPAEEFKQIDFEGNKLQVCKAPEPLEIIWENIMTEDWKKHTKRIHSFLYTTFSLTLYTIIIYYMNNNDNDEDDNNTNNSQRKNNNNLNFHGEKGFSNRASVQREDTSDDGYSFAQLINDQFSNLTVSVIMIILNSLVIKNAFKFIVDNECYSTYSLYKIKMAQKLSIALFISNALVTTFISIVYSHNIYGNGGLIYVMIFFLALDTLSSCASEMINMPQLMNQVLQYYYRSKGSKCKLTQDKANSLFERPVHEIEMCYSEIINTMYISVFYCPIIPVGLILSLVGITLYYWVQKYTLIHCRTVKQQISVKLSQAMTDSLELIVFIYPLSNVIFHFISKGSATALQLISLIFGGVFFLIPTETLVKSIFKFKEVEQEQQTYEIALTRFQTTYARMNPITSEIANSSYYSKYAHRVSVSKRQISGVDNPLNFSGNFSNPQQASPQMLAANNNNVLGNSGNLNTNFSNINNPMIFSGNQSNNTINFSGNQQSNLMNFSGNQGNANNALNNNGHIITYTLYSQ